MKIEAPQETGNDLDLYQASQAGALHRVIHLVEKENIDPNTRDDQDCTALHWAAHVLPLRRSPGGFNFLE